MGEMLTSLRRHFCGLLEAHTFASFIAMAVTAGVASYEQFSSSTWHGAMEVFIAPFALPFLVVARVHPEPDFMPALRRVALVIYAVMFFLIAARRWGQWGAQLIARDYGTGRIANIRRNLGDGIAMALAYWFGITVVVMIVLVAIADAALAGGPVLQLLVAFVLVGGVYIAVMDVFLDYLKAPVKIDNPCRGCGYNLTGNVSGVCAECGTAIS